MKTGIWAILALSVLLYGCEFRLHVESSPIWAIGTKVMHKGGGQHMVVVDRISNKIETTWVDESGQYHKDWFDDAELEQR